MPPNVCMPPYICIPLWRFVHPKGSNTPCMFPILLSASVCSKRHLHGVGVVGGPLHVGHLPHMVDSSPYVLPSTHWLASLCICMFKWISSCDMDNTLLMLGVWGKIPHMLGVWGHQHLYLARCLAVHPLGVHYALSCTFLIAHYVSCIYHGYDYYSCSYSGVFWSVIYFISDQGPFLVGASCSIWSA